MSTPPDSLPDRKPLLVRTAVFRNGGHLDGYAVVFPDDPNYQPHYEDGLNALRRLREPMRYATAEDIADCRPERADPSGFLPETLPPRRPLLLPPSEWPASIRLNYDITFPDQADYQSRYGESLEALRRFYQPMPYATDREIIDLMLDSYIDHVPDDDPLSHERLPARRPLFISSCEWQDGRYEGWTTVIFPDEPDYETHYAEGLKDLLLFGQPMNYAIDFAILSWRPDRANAVTEELPWGDTPPQRKPLYVFTEDFYDGVHTKGYTVVFPDESDYGRYYWSGLHWLQYEATPMPYATEEQIAELRPDRAGTAEHAASPPRSPE